MRYGVRRDQILESGNDQDIAIAGEVTVYSKSFKFPESEYFSLEYKASSDGTVNLKIELEQSNVLPTTGGSSDANYVEAENMQDIDDGLVDKNKHYIKISPVVTKYGRLKITGQTGNDASTTLEAFLGYQEG